MNNETETETDALKKFEPRWIGEKQEKVVPLGRGEILRRVGRDDKQSDALRRINE